MLADGKNEKYWKNEIWKKNKLKKVKNRWSERIKSWLKERASEWITDEK